MVKTRELRDKQVSIQVGPLVVMPLTGIALVLRPEVAETLVACAVLAIATLRHSRAYYQHIRRT
ncbi:hypothetical protein ACIPMU_39045 [Streptomyces cyaneofuscatus]|uniref:hypothetical protein n=1 Tax=Streptomyces cyaneofuscatus TaxID=66883 RepID=UPI00381C0D39